MVEPSDVVAQTATADPEVGLRGMALLRALLEAVKGLQVRRARARLERATDRRAARRVPSRRCTRSMERASTGHEGGFDEAAAAAYPATQEGGQASGAVSRRGS